MNQFWLLISFKKRENETSSEKRLNGAIATVDWTSVMVVITSTVTISPDQHARNRLYSFEVFPKERRTSRKLCF